MKRCRIWIFALALFFTGCSRQEPKNYVKDITVDKSGDIYTIVLKYYDFSQKQESYMQAQYSGENLPHLAVKAAEDKNYSFRLCENMFLSGRLVEKDIDNVFLLAQAVRLAPNVMISCFTAPLEDNIEIKGICGMPYYDFSFEKGQCRGRIPAIDSAGKVLGAVIIKEGRAVKVMDSNRWSVLNILSGDSREMDFVFSGGEMFAELRKINTYFSIDDDVLHIQVDMTLADYKGMSATPRGQELFITMAKSELEKIVYDIMSDVAVNSVYNLDWYSRAKGEEYEDISVNVDIH